MVVSKSRFYVKNVVIYFRDFSNVFCYVISLSLSLSLSLPLPLSLSLSLSLSLFLSLSGGLEFF